MTEIERLRRENRMLAKRLERSEINRRRLEDFKERSAAIHRAVIDDLRRTRDALVRSEQQAHAASRAKSEFLAGISHELRTPLTAILGYVELVLEDSLQLPEESREDLRQVADAARHLSRVIDALLDMSRIEAGRMTFAREDVDCARLLEGVVGTMTPVIEQTTNRLQLQVDACPAVYSDGTRIRQVVLNLLGNAARYTRDGTIQLRAGTEGGAFVVRVVDNGPGIDPGDLERIFEPFARAKKLRIDDPGGAGLGLAISRRIVEQLGGTLTVRSKVGVGTAFTLRLPPAAPAPSLDGDQ